MKKLSLAFLSTVSLVALTTGCSSSEVIEEGPALQTGVITFGTTNIAKPSRAEVEGILSNSNFDEFHVFGCYSTGALKDVNIFTGDPVTKQSDGKWTYTGDRYWLENATYNFYAYSCGNMEEKLSNKGYANPSLVDGVLEIADFNLHADHDLIFAEKTGIEIGKYAGSNDASVLPPSVVNLEFKHILTRVMFSFKGEVPDKNYKITVSDVQINGLLNNATYNEGGNHRWNNYSNKLQSVDIEVNNNGDVPCYVATDENADKSASMSCDPIFVIPNQEYKETHDDNSNTVELHFLMTISRNNQNVVQRTVKASWNPDWAQGKSVNNVITLSFQNATGLKPITFSAKIEAGGSDADDDSWEDVTGGLSGLSFSSQAVVSE